MGEDHLQANNQSSLLFSFYSDDSYEPLDIGPDPATLKARPQCVPSLNLLNMPEYESSSDEEESAPDEGHNQQQMRNMTT